LTSSAVSGAPLWKVTPWRSVKSYVRPFSLSLQDSARLEAYGLSGMDFTEASCRA
jgi:hypothetical protein